MFIPYWWKPLCISQMNMAHTLWNSIALKDFSWCLWSFRGFCSQVEGQRDFYGSAISYRLQFGCIDGGLKRSNMAGAHGPSSVWDPQQALSIPNDTLSMVPAMLSCIFCEINFVSLRDHSHSDQQNQKINWRGQFIWFLLSLNSLQASVMLGTNQTTTVTSLHPQTVWFRSQIRSVFKLPEIGS